MSNNSELPNKSFIVIINGQKHTIHTRIVNKDVIGKLAFENTEWYKRLKSNPFKVRDIIRAMSCSYKNAHPDSGKIEGVLSDDTIRIQDGTVFNIYETSNA